MSENDSKVTLATRIIERLHQFNRKERDHLMKFALCKDPAAPRISDSLWKLISNGGTRPDPKRMFIGMDYHMNWLYATLATPGIAADQKKAAGTGDGPLKNEWICDVPHEFADERGGPQPIQGNQEDVDLLIAWIKPKSERPLRLVLVEAKLDSSWGSAQFDKKRKRLTLIKRDSEQGVHEGLIQWKFLLLSPGSEPSKGKFETRQAASDRFNWMYFGPDDRLRDKLWHANLPKIGGDMQVKRTSASSGEWEIAPIKTGSKS